MRYSENSGAPYTATKCDTLEKRKITNRAVLSFCSHTIKLGIFVHRLQNRNLLRSLLDRKCTYKRKRESRSRDHCCRGNALCSTYSECVSVTLVIENAKLMYRILFLSVACLAVPYFFFHITSRTARFLGGKKMSLNIKCVFRFSLQNLSETFFILRRNERDMIENVYWSSCKGPVIVVRF